MINYKIKAIHNPLDRDEVKYYPQIVVASIRSIESIIKRISSRTTVTSSDVRAVIDALKYEVIDGLEQGQIVRLGDLGTLRPTIQSDGVSSYKEARSKGTSLIKKLNVSFLWSTELKNSLQLSNLEFSFFKDVVSDTGGDENTDADESTVDDESTDADV